MLGKSWISYRNHAKNIHIYNHTEEDEVVVIKNLMKKNWRKLSDDGKKLKR